MCTCIQEQEESILRIQPIPRRKIVSVKVSRAPNFKRGCKADMRPQMDFYCQVEGYAARKRFSVFISYCPFCGENLY